jgi:hypothetical protein
MVSIFTRREISGGRGVRERVITGTKALLVVMEAGLDDPPLEDQETKSVTPATSAMSKYVPALLAPSSPIC